jgi:hypothetical protein
MHVTLTTCRRQPYYSDRSQSSCCSPASRTYPGSFAYLQRCTHSHSRCVVNGASHAGFGCTRCLAGLFEHAARLLPVALDHRSTVAVAVDVAAAHLAIRRSCQTGPAASNAVSLMHWGTLQMLLTC